MNAHRRRLDAIGLHDSDAIRLHRLAKVVHTLCRTHDRMLREGLHAPIGSIMRKAFARMRGVQSRMNKDVVKRYKLNVKSMLEFMKGDEPLAVGPALAHLRETCSRMSYALASEYLKARLQAHLWRTAPPGGEAARQFDVDAVVKYALHRTALSEKTMGTVLDAYLKHRHNVHRMQEAYGPPVETWPFGRAERALEGALRRQHGHHISVEQEQTFVDRAVRRKETARAATQFADEAEFVVPQPRKKRRTLPAGCTDVNPDSAKPLTKRGDQMCAEECRRAGSRFGLCWCPLAGGSWDYCRDEACTV